MAEPVTDEMMMDLMFATTRTLKAICQHLIDKGALSRELLLADLVQAQAEIAAKTSGKWSTLPAMLCAELGGQSPKQQL